MIFKTKQTAAAQAPNEANREVYLAMRRYMKKEEPSSFAALKQTCRDAQPALDEKAADRVAKSLTSDWTMRHFYHKLRSEVIRTVAPGIGLIAASAMAIWVGLGCLPEKAHIVVKIDTYFWCGVAFAAACVSAYMLVSMTRGVFKTVKGATARLLEKLAGKEIGTYVEEHMGL